MSRITISSSASAGCPLRPRRDETKPSCMHVPCDNEVTSQCWARMTPSPPAYSSARRISASSCTPLPSSVNSETPRAAISAIGANRSPARSTVIAPEVCTAHGADRPSSSTSRTTSAESIVGVVLGMANTAVNPPRAAARPPLSIVSASSLPGWRRCVCRSTSPGETTQSPQSNVMSAVASVASGPTAATRPSRTRTSADVPSPLSPGVQGRPPRSLTVGLGPVLIGAPRGAAARCLLGRRLLGRCLLRRCPGPARQARRYRGWRYRGWRPTPRTAPPCGWERRWPPGR